MADQHPDSPLARDLIGSRRVIVIAHRGDSKVAPENTLPAFASAVRVGSGLVELDYHHSADNVPVVIHDAELDRTTNAKALWGGEKIRVVSKTLAELRRLDAGSWFDAKFAGTRIPSLEEALETIQAGSMTLIEHKAGDAQTCVNLLKRKGLLDRVVVQSFDWKFLQDCRQLSSELIMAALGKGELSADKLQQIVAFGPQAVAWEDKSTSKASIETIHSRGWKAWVWTVDDPQRMRELIAAGIDAIITNRPQELRRVLFDLS